MQKLTHSRLTLENLLKLQEASEMSTITYNKIPFGIYIPCSFGSDGNPNWEQIQATIRRTQYTESVESEDR